MILCIGTTPAAQRVMAFRKLTIDAVNRAVTTLDGAAGKSVNVAKVLKALGEQPVATRALGGGRGDATLWPRASGGGRVGNICGLGSKPAALSGILWRWPPDPRQESRWPQ